MLKPLVFVLILAVFVAGCTNYAAQPPTQDVVKPDGTTTGTEQGSYTGQKLAGSTTPYIRFSQADFDQARAEGMAIYVFYYATWCPICLSERPRIMDTFNQASLPTVIGFEAHWNDGQNTPDDDAFARENGVAYQHTHLFFDKTGALVGKAVSSLPAGELEARLQAIA